MFVLSILYFRKDKFLGLCEKYFRITTKMRLIIVTNSSCVHWSVTVPLCWRVSSNVSRIFSLCRKCFVSKRCVSSATFKQACSALTKFLFFCFWQGPAMRQKIFREYKGNLQITKAKLKILDRCGNILEYGWNNFHNW